MFQCHLRGTGAESRIRRLRNRRSRTASEIIYSPTVKDVDKAIEKIRFSHATRKYKYPVFEGRELIDQKTLAKMAGVSRQTVARWEELGFISRSDIGLSGNKYFVIKEVVSQLERLKDVK